MHDALKAVVAPLIVALTAGFAIAVLPDLLASAIIAYSHAASLAGLAVVDSLDAKSSFHAESAQGDYEIPADRGPIPRRLACAARGLQIPEKSRTRAASSPLLAAR